MKEKVFRSFVSFALFVVFGFFAFEKSFADPAILEKLNQGWPASLQPLVPSLNPHKSYVAVVIKAPLANMDMRSADQLRRSLLATADKYRGEIGHAMFGWSCHSASGRTTGFVSQSGERSFQSMQMLKQGWGFSAIFSSFNDGVIFTPEENENRTLSKYINSQDPHLFAMIVSVPDQDCNSVLQFIDQYTNINPNIGSYPFQNFGLQYDPKSLTGGGCSSFMLAALSHTKVFWNLQNLFYRTLKFPKSLFGRPMNLNTDYVDPFVAKFAPVGKTISLAKAMGSDWDQSTDNTLELKMIDPESLVLFVKTLNAMAMSDEISKGLLSEYSASREEWRLQRRMNYLVRPENRMDYPTGRTFDVIDQNYDEVAHSLVMQMKDLRNNSEYKFAEVKRLSWNKQIAVLVENR